MQGHGDFGHWFNENAASLFAGHHVVIAVAYIPSVLPATPNIV
jgi:hypothetical protein